MPTHRLGPSVVGQRVVVRSVVPGETGPTGGVAFRDVLGVCTAWGADACVIDSERGPVEIPLALIVSGKPVPPRPSVRHRVSVRDAELHTRSWRRGAEVEPLGEWLLRLEPEQDRVRSRFNSCLAIGDPGVPDTLALDRVRGFYAAREREPLLHVELGTTFDGWEPVPGKDAHLQLASLAQVRRRLGRCEVEVVLETGAGGPVARAHAGAGVIGGRLEGQCEGLLDGDWIGLDSLHVEPELRRRGLARAMIAVLLDWGAEQGATTAWLHVETANAPALALYERLGFRTHHTMGYLRPSSRV